ncbi:hypothetical protein [Streptomyces sp. NPDC102437]|uniref:hypothetical protein n=1 Tax=Streptomyces sp. NPDC102437 TaxID=3366175 RepID=UPI003804B690
MSFGHQPLGVLCDTGRTKGDNPNHAYMYGTGPAADEIGSQPDLRFMTNLELLPRNAETTPENWLEYNARQMPYDAWPIAGAKSRMEPLEERVPSAEAAREDRCLTRDQAVRYLTDRSDRKIVIGKEGWIRLQKAGNAPAPRHYALDGLMPLWHVNDLDAYATRDYELWPVSWIAEYLGYTGTAASATARKQLSRWNVFPVTRQPGANGEHMYADDQVRALHAHRPGKGRHGAARDGGKFTADPA